MDVMALSKEFFQKMDTPTLNYYVSDILYYLDYYKNDLVRHYTKIDNLCLNLRKINQVLYERRLVDENNFKTQTI